MTETIYSLATGKTYEIEIKRHTENNSVCPECSHNRKKKTAKSFSYNAEKEVGYCNHCEARFVKHKPFEKKEYLKPTLNWQNFTKISDKVVKWFEGRGISQRTLLKMKIGEKKEFLPQEEKESNCIMFPYFKKSELINAKFRDAKKNFKLISGAELIWYNYDAIHNSIEEGTDLIIVEGEIDALSFIQAGFDNVISVPNGASVGRMEYFDSSFEDLSKVKSFIIATDNDVKGIELKNDLVRRLGMEKCKILSFKQYKDANEYLISEGSENLFNLTKEAKFLKLSDIYEVQDFQKDLDAYFEEGLPQGKTLGIPELDERIRWQTGRFGVGTGIPGSGKSEFLDFVYSRLNILYGWKIGAYVPEAMPLPLHFSRLFPKFTGKEYNKKIITEAEKISGEDYINENVFWVSPEYDFELDEILARFEYLVKSKGCKLFVIDPFNRIEQGANHSDNERLFIKKALVKMTNFAKKTDSLLHLIAHPTKMSKDDKGKFKVPTPYDISGSADFWNMPEYCWSVGRAQDDEGKFLSYGFVVVSKTKVNKTMGTPGIWNYWYNLNNGRYITDNLDGSERKWDNSNWITKEEFKIPVASVQEAFSYNEDDECPF